MNNKIYVLHENGMHSHFRALEYLSLQRGHKVVYREFSIIKSIMRCDLHVFKKQLLNIFFLLELIITKNKKIVLGIAPYDFRLPFLSLLLRRHKLYYYTSWVCWDRSFYPKKLFVNTNLITFWERYISTKFLKIFSVSSFAKSDLIKCLKLDKSKIAVVSHSCDDTIYNYKDREIELAFLYVGRLDKSKGLIELLDYFSRNSSLSFNIVGDGKLISIVKEYASKYKNIRYFGLVTNQNQLAEIYNQNSFLILNSKKTEKWEELFGMVIIEAMACGVIPITTDHKGPSEIITNKLDGFISKEEDFIHMLDNLVIKYKSSKELFLEITKNAIQTGRKYYVTNISKRWQSIFE